MTITTKTVAGHTVAVIAAEEILMGDPQAAMDLMATAKYETDCDAMVLPKAVFPERFFDLSTRLAGETMQKYINYQMKLAIVGNFSGYTSKSLADYIRECNRGKDIFFVQTEEEAIRMLAAAF